MLDIFEELNSLYEEADQITEANNNFASDKAKTALVKKYLANGNSEAPAADPQEVKDIKARSILHHLNGDHSNDEHLVNDLLIIGANADTAKLAHKIIHLLSYAYIKEDLERKLAELDVQFYYHPDHSNHEEVISIKDIAADLAQHSKQLGDIALIDADERSVNPGTDNNFDIMD